MFVCFLNSLSKILVLVMLRGIWVSLVPQPGTEAASLHWKHEVLATGPPGKPCKLYLSEEINLCVLNLQC